MRRLEPREARLELAEPGTSERGPRSRLFLHDKDMGLVTGAVLEAAVALDPGSLLFVTDDLPFEEGLRLLLLDAAGQVTEQRRLFVPYATGVFGALELLPPDRLAFDFFDDRRWTVRIHAQPRFALPLVGEPRGVWPDGRLRHRISFEAGPRRSRGEAATPLDSRRTPL